MAKITLKGSEINTIGELPEVGSSAKDFSLVAADLSEKNLASYEGKKKILNIVPSLDTDVCATSTRVYNEKAGSRDDAVILVVSKDLPFAMKRFCETEGTKNVESLSDFRGSFSEDYGVTISDGPLKGLTSRAIVVLNEKNEVVYTEQVAEVTQEPDYAKALVALG